jgi:hypothetical protein
MTRPTPKLEKQNGRWTFEGGKPRAAPKHQIERDTSAFASGGNTPMFGRGDRTRTATQDAAGTQTPGQTTTKSKDNLQRAKGGRPRDEGWGVALAAQPGCCAPVRPDRRR